MQKPIISIIIPIYNVEEYLEMTLQSLEDQSFRDYEVIAVDDGSTDASADIAKSFAARDKRFVYVRKDNAGVSAARNTGIEMARGKYMLFVDADDLLTSCALENLYRAAEKYEADITTGKLMHLKGDKYTIVRMSEIVFSEFKSFTTFKESPKLVYDSITCGKLIRKSYWDELEVSFPENLSYCEDMPVSFKLYCETERIALIDEVVYLWRVRGGESKSATQNKNLGMAEQRLTSLRMINSLSERLRPGDEVCHEMKIKSLMMDFNIWANKIAEMDKPTAEKVMEIIGEYMNEAKLPAEFKCIPAIYTEKYKAIIERNYDRLKELRYFQTDINSCIKTRKIGKTVIGLFPRNITPLGIVNMKSTISHELLRQRVRKVEIEDGIIVEGCAYLRYLPVRTPEDVKMQGWIVDEERNRIRRIRTRQCSTTTPFGIEKKINSNRVAYAGTGYELSIGYDDFKGLDSGRYRILIDWESNGEKRSSFAFPFHKEVIDEIMEKGVLGDNIRMIDITLRNEPVFVI